MANLGRKLFWRCSGVTISVLEQPGCETDYNKHAAIGATVLMTGILAGLSGGYAFHRAFGMYRAALPLAVFWGLLILNLDRFMVMSIRKKDVPAGDWPAWVKTKTLEVLASVPRLLLAFLLALVIAKPLELKLFQPEVDLEVLDLKRDMEAAARKISVQATTGQTTDNQGQQVAADRIKFLKDENGTLLTATTDAYREWQRLNELARKELYGEKGPAADDLTGDPGPGKQYRNRQAAADAAKAAYDRVAEIDSKQIGQNNSELQRLVSAQAALEAQASEKRFATDGLAIRLAALSQLTSKDKVSPYSDFEVYRLQGSVYRYANLGIIAIIVLLELAPILSKIFVSYGPYDRAVEAAEERAKLLQEQETLKVQAGLEVLRASREKRRRAVLEVQDAMLADLKNEIRSVTDDSQITKSELNEMKRGLIRKAIADLHGADGNRQKR